MRQLRRPIRLCSRKMSRWMATVKSRRTRPVCSHTAMELLAGWWISDEHYSSRSRSEWSAPKNDKSCVTYHWYHMHACLFLDAQPPPQKKKKLRLVLVRARTAVKILFRYSAGKIKSNPLEPHCQTSATMSRCLQRTKTAVALPHCNEST